MIQVPIKLYYNRQGEIQLEHNQNETPLITSFSSLSYRLYLYVLKWIDSEPIPAVEASFQKADGTQETLAMAYSNEMTDEYSQTWYCYICDLTQSIVEIANSFGTNNLLVSFNYLSGSNQVILNTEAFTLHCTYAIRNALVEFEMTPMEYYQYQYNLALQQRAMENQTVLHVDYLPEPSSYNNGYVYVLEQDNGNFLKGDIVISNGSTYELVCNKPNTILLNATSGTLSNQNYAYAQRENTVIVVKVDNELVQFGQVEDNNDNFIYRSRIYVNSGVDYVNMAYHILTIDKTTKAYSVQEYNENFYNKQESDTLLALKEDVANKATNFTTIDNTKYPTTKAVDDFFEGKIEETAYYPVVVEADFEETITLSNDDFNKLTQQNNVVLVWVSPSTNIVRSQMFKDYSVSSQTVYYGTATYIDRYTNYFTVRIYKCTIDNTNQTCRITDNAKVAYDKAFIDSKLSEYLKNASANGDTLTINGVYNNSPSQTTFNVSGKLNKDFSGENVLPQPIGQNDYFIINVSGVPYKVSWQTIYDQLGVGGLTEHFKGTYNSLSALETAYPTASAGDYAYITKIVSGDTILTMAIWDNTDNEWQVQDLSQYVSQQVFEDTVDDLQDDIDSKSSVTLVEWS